MSIFEFAKKARGHMTPMLGGGGGSSSGTQTTTQQLPPQLQPLSTQIATQGAQLGQQPIPQYGGPTYAQANPQQQGAAQNVQNLAGSGGVGGAVSGAVIGSANNGGNAAPTVTAGTATAGYNPYADSQNPYIQQQVAAANKQTTNAFQQNAMGLNSQFAGSGAFGGSAYQNAMDQQNQALGQSLSNNAATMYGGAYNTAAQAAGQNAALQTQASIANQQAGLQAANLNSSNYNLGQNRALTAAGLAPSLDSNTINQNTASWTLGSGLQTDQQNQLNADYQKWYSQNMSPYQQLGVLESALAGANGGGAQGITSTTQSANPWGTGLAYGMMGAGSLLSGLGSMSSSF